MTEILIDHNLDHNLAGLSTLLFGALQAQGWIQLLDLRMVTFPEAQLARTDSDRVVWHRAQAGNMILLTGNRAIMGPDSLEETTRQENSPTAMPVVTISSATRLKDRIYRERCALRLAEIVFDLDSYLGAGRIFIP